MGIIKMRNPIFSKRFRRTEMRLLIIDDNQIRYNQICKQLTDNGHTVHATLLDDISAFEKQINLTWDLVLFGKAYDLAIDQAIALIRASKQPNLPVLLLQPADYQWSEYTSYINKGIYDIVHLDYPQRFYYGVMRTLSFSRLQQAQKLLENELENAHTQTQFLVEESNKAIAIIQEGIHVQANQEYLELFGLEKEEDIIGLPLLDILQPENIAEFRFRFKKASQHCFDLGIFDLISNHPKLKVKNPLKVDFLATVNQDDNELQLVIDLPSVQKTEKNLSAPQTTQVATANTTVKRTPLQHLHFLLSQNPAAYNALVLFTPASYPDAVFHHEWNTITRYADETKKFLKEQLNISLITIDINTLVGVFQAESGSTLESKLIGLGALERSKVLNVDGVSYALHLKIGYQKLDQVPQTEEQFHALIAQAFKTALPKPIQHEEEQALELDFKLDVAQPVVETQAIELEPVEQAQTMQLEPKNEVVIEEPVEGLSVKLPEDNSILGKLRRALDHNQINLEYQQLYDKQDINLYTYEVTSYFIDEHNQRHNCNQISLDEDPELSIRLDRSILVEACKQLHNFITQYPEAKLLINLRKHILVQDHSLPDLTAKLVTIIGSAAAAPIILQFDTDEVYQNLDIAKKQFVELIESGAEISLRHFSDSIYNQLLLEQITIHYAMLDQKFTSYLNSEEQTQALEEFLIELKAIQDIEFILIELDDMNSFANAWNVEARYIQGDYFQKKLGHLSDVQDQ